ncbi:conserved hypothetical protein, partial [Trichinella spiralis]
MTSCTTAVLRDILPKCSIPWGHNQCCNNLGNTNEPIKSYPIRILRRICI